MGGFDSGSAKRARQGPSSPQGVARGLRNPTIRGVTLAQYATVQAGLAEGFKPAAILAREGIDARAWERASTGFAERLADDDETLELSYDAFLEVAQDRYARPLPPIDRDVRAWLDFLRRWSAHEDPARLLTTLALRPTDVIRLNRFWSKRFASEPELAREIEAILSTDAGPLPAVSPAPVMLDALAAPAAPPATDGELELTEDEDDDLDQEEQDDAEGVKRRPRLFVDPPGFDRQRPRVEQPRAPVVTAPPAPPRSDAGPPERALPTFLAAASRALPASVPALTASQPHITSLGTTGELPLDLVKAIAAGALPFARSTGPQPEPGSAPPTAPPSRGEAARAPVTHRTTALPLDLVQQIAKGTLPFRSESTKDPEPTTLDGEPSPLAGAVLPFGRAASGGDRAAPVSIATSEIPRDLVQQMAKGTLPFQPSAPAVNAPPTARREPPREPPPVSAPEAPGERTVEAQPSPIKAALPFLRSSSKDRVATEATPPAQPSDAKGAGQTAPPAAAPTRPAGELTLEQYASMCAELAVFGDRAEAVFAKYGLTDPRRRAAVDAAWKERLSRYPSERAEWERRYRQYETAWKRSRGQSRGT